MNIQAPGSILVVADRSPADAELLVKAARVAKRFGAKLELLLCDSEHAYALEHAYERSGVETVRQHCVAEALAYLTRLKGSVTAQGVEVLIDASCQSPLYEGIVRKVLSSRPGLVIKTAGEVDARGRATFDANDWQLMRACPVTIMLTRGRRWSARPRFAAAVDVSDEETEGLAKLILENAASMAGQCDGELELLYAESTGTAQAAATAHVAAMDRLIQRSHLEKADVHILAGDPERTLPAFARQRNYDVLVMGALSHRVELTAMVGSLTSRLVDALECDFVLVKPACYRSPLGACASGYGGRLGR